MGQLVRGLIEIDEDTPLLLRRIERKPENQTHPLSSAHVTVATTPGYRPEMNDQQEDATRYDRD